MNIQLYLLTLGGTWGWTGGACCRVDGG